MLAFGSLLCTIAHKGVDARVSWIKVILKGILEISQYSMFDCNWLKIKVDNGINIPESWESVEVKAVSKVIQRSSMFYFSLQFVDERVSPEDKEIKFLMPKAS